MLKSIEVLARVPHLNTILGTNSYSPSKETPLMNQMQKQHQDVISIIYFQFTCRIQYKNLGKLRNLY